MEATASSDHVRRCWQSSVVPTVLQLQPNIYLQDFPRTLGSPAALVIFGFHVALCSILKGASYIPLHHICTVAPAFETKQDLVKHLVAGSGSQTPSKNSRPGIACNCPLICRGDLSWGEIAKGLSGNNQFTDAIPLTQRKGREWVIFN